MLALQVEHEVEYLRLDRHVERGHRLVRDDQRRPQHQRPGQAEALALPPGELVRVALGRHGRQAHLVEQRADPPPLLGPVSFALDDERLAQDRADPHPRVHGRIGVLEHQLHLARLAPPLPVRQRRQVPPAEHD